MHEIENNVQIFGDTETRKFKFKLDGKLAKILSDGVYSDGIKAPIREYATNAWDSHVAAGKENVPFHVHLPNDIEPWYSTRDFGLGLSHEDIGEYFCTYGASNKMNTDKLIGYLGLGSKAGFAYTKGSAFTVTSILNGKKRSYTIKHDSEGIPDCSTLGDEIDTDECNGVEVIIPVKREDFPKFVKLANDVLKFFYPTPIVVGDSSFEIHNPKYAAVDVDGEWGIREDNFSYGYDNVIAIQGCVPYPVSRDTLQSLGFANLSKLKLDLFFGIGNLEFAASREALSYDEKTTEHIRKSVTKFRDTIIGNCAKEIENCQNGWEVNLVIRGYLVKYGLNDIFQDETYIWRGEEFNHTNTYSFYRDDVIPNDVEPQYDTKFKVYHYVPKKSRKTIRPKYDGDYKFAIRGDTEIFWKDDAKLWNVKMVNYAKNVSPDNNIFVIDCGPVEGREDEVISNIRKLIGNINIRRVSELPLPEKVKRKFQEEDGIRKYIRSRYGRTRRTASSHWEMDTDKDISSGGFYVPTKNNRILVKNGETTEYIDFDKYEDVLAHMEYISLQKKNWSDIPVYGIKEKDVKNLKGNWINLIEYMKDVFSKKVDYKSIECAKSSLTEFDCSDAAYIDGQYKEFFDRDDLPTDVSEFYTEHKRLSEMGKVTNTVANNKRMRLTKFFKLDTMVDNKSDFTLDDDYMKIKTKYPMVFLNGIHGSIQKSDIVADYMKLVDKKGDI